MPPIVVDRTPAENHLRQKIRSRTHNLYLSIIMRIFFTSVILLLGSIVSAAPTTSDDVEKRGYEYYPSDKVRGGMFIV